jgi:hypothetical protein
LGWLRERLPAVAVRRPNQNRSAIPGPKAPSCWCRFPFSGDTVLQSLRAKVPEPGSRPSLPAQQLRTTDVRPARPILVEPRRTVRGRGFPKPGLGPIRSKSSKTCILTSLITPSRPKPKSSDRASATSRPGSRVPNLKDGPIRPQTCSIKVPSAHGMQCPMRAQVYSRMHSDVGCTPA